MPGIQELNRSFDFDWNDYRTIKPNQDKVPAAEEGLAVFLSQADSLNDEDKHALGQLCYKLGTFYNHVKRAPNLALKVLEHAATLLKGYELAWVHNHIAFSYQQRLAAKKIAVKNKDDVDAQITSRYLDLITKEYGNKKSSEVTKEEAKIGAFAWCVHGLMEYEFKHLGHAEYCYEDALKLYNKVNLNDDQFARAKNRYAQIIAEQGKDYPKAKKLFAELEVYWSQKEDPLNPYAARFYASYAAFLELTEPKNVNLILENYKKAYAILSKAEGEESPFTRDMHKKIEDIETKLMQDALNQALNGIANQLMSLPFQVRETLIESLVTVLLRGFLPMSGRTVQQQVTAASETLGQLNELMQAKGTYRNGHDPRYAYQFAREATSAGVIPVYRDKTTGDLYVGLICNKRNLNMYNWSAGYTEAPPAPWIGKLQSETERDVYYDRLKIKNSGTHTLNKALEAAGGDWTKVVLDYKLFEEGFKADGVVLPKIDINSEQTAARECLEEMGLDLSKFPDRKSFLISYDNTVGISMGDAPGQTSNRSHQYMVYLGELDKAPDIKAGDDVGIADWVKVSDIQRVTPTDYQAHGKSLCVYMLYGLEKGLQSLWQHLLQQASTTLSQFNQTTMTRFSTTENVAAEIENYCVASGIAIEGTVIPPFLKMLCGEMPANTYTGEGAQTFLNILLNTVKYLLSAERKPGNFVNWMTFLLTGVEQHPKFYAEGASFLQFSTPAQKPASAPVKDDQIVTNTLGNSC